MINLSDKLRQRFHRNIIIPDLGEDGQVKLLNSSALIIGVGGLGSASSLYLAAAGFGKLGLVDSDLVELSNLQRQVIHKEKNIGMKKTESAEIQLKELFPEIEIKQYPIRLNEENAVPIFSQYDVILDASDNFPTRYLMNYTAIKLRKPIIMGAVLAFSGQVTTILPGKSPCYACLFPDPPPETVFPQGAVMGIIGTTPGIIGLIQATEAIKLILGIGTLLTGRVMLYDGLNMVFDTIRYCRDPNCRVCRNIYTE